MRLENGPASTGVLHDLCICILLHSAQKGASGREERRGSYRPTIQCMTDTRRPSAFGVSLRWGTRSCLSRGSRQLEKASSIDWEIVGWSPVREAKIGLRARAFQRAEFLDSKFQLIQPTSLIPLPQPRILPYNMSAANAHASSSKHHKHHKSEDKHKSKRGDKSDKKSKHHKDGSSSSSSSSSKSYQHRTCRMRMSIPPKYSGDWLTGVVEILDAMLIRWVAGLGETFMAAGRSLTAGMCRRLGVCSSRTGNTLSWTTRSRSSTNVLTACVRWSSGRWCGRRRSGSDSVSSPRPRFHSGEL